MPGALTLIQAHKALEDLCLEREVLHYKLGVEQKWAELVYNGLWFSPLKEALDGFVDTTQKLVTGDVRLRFFKGSCVVVGRRSPVLAVRLQPGDLRRRRHVRPQGRQGLHRPVGSAHEGLGPPAPQGRQGRRGVGRAAPRHEDRILSRLELSPRDPGAGRHVHRRLVRRAREGSRAGPCRGDAPEGEQGWLIRRRRGAAGSKARSTSSSPSSAPRCPWTRRCGQQDIRGSIAHVRMLARQGIIPAEDAAAIEDGLLRGRRGPAVGRLRLRQRRRGHPHGGRARSARQDRVGRRQAPHGPHRATTRWRSTRACGRRARRARLAEAVVALQHDARRAAPDEHLEAGTVMPGYTHLQKAQPVLLAHHLLAYVWMLGARRDAAAPRVRGRRRHAARQRRARGHDVPHRPPLRRRRARLRRRHAQLAGRRRPTATSCSTSRTPAAMTMMHLSRLCEELILWSIGRVRLRDHGRRLRDGQLDHAAEEEPGRRRARARQDRPRLRRPRRRCSR